MCFEYLEKLHHKNNSITFFIFCSSHTTHVCMKPILIHITIMHRSYLWFLWHSVSQTIKTNLTRDNEFVRDSMVTLTNQFKRYENYSNVMISIKKDISSLGLQLLQKDSTENREQVLYPDQYPTWEAHTNCLTDWMFWWLLTCWINRLAHSHGGFTHY